MIVHPLRQAFNTAVRERYGVKIGGDKHPAATDAAAKRIHRMGISFEQFVDIALKIWDGYSKRQGWKYPYWTCILSPKTFERISALIKQSNGFNDEEVPQQIQYEYEVNYGAGIIRWMLGELEQRPYRETDTLPHIRAKAAADLRLYFKVPETVGDNYIKMAQHVLRAEKWQDEQQRKV